MPNPYYIPRDSSLSSDILDVAKLGATLYGIKQTGDIAKMNAGLTEKEIAARNRMTDVTEAEAFGRPGQPGRLAIAQQEADTDAAKLPASARKWDMGSFTGIATKLKLAGVPVDILSGMNDLKAWATDETMKRGDVANALAGSWPKFKQQSLEELNDYANKLSDKAMNLGENDPERQKIMKQLEKIIGFQGEISDIPDDKAKEIFFPDVAQEEALEVAKALKGHGGTDVSFQSKGVTEKGGFPIIFNPKTAETIVRKPNGAAELYDPKIHGKELSPTLSQTTIYNQGSNAAGAFKPGTLEYMVEKFETDGVIPPFGMGSVGARQRAAFFDMAAKRAKERGDSGGAQAIRGAEFKTSQSVLNDLTKREQLIESYNVRINETSDKVLIPLIKKWDLQNPRFINWPVNKLKEIMGSGDLAALKLALNSVSVEVGKVEFNALGIQQLTDSAAKFMNTVHDPNMKVGELLKVIETSKALGQTGSNAISGQRKSLLGRMRKIAPESGEEVNTRDISAAVLYLSGGTRESAVKRIQALAAQGWTEQELEKIAKEAGWE